MPDAVALEHDGTAVTYRELDARAERLARRLARGLAESAGEPRVAVHLDRQPELPVALLAVLKAGAAYVPLVTGLPARRIAEVLAAARPAIVLTTAARRGRLPATEARMLVLDRLDGEPDETADSPAPREVHEGSAAYVVFTSGSTGRPKGVVVPHRALAAHAEEIARRYELAPADRVLQFASPAFDVAAEEIFPTWAAGATLVLPHGRLPEAPRSFRALLDERRLTVLNLPSSYWNEWIAATVAAALPAPPSLRLLVLGSEPVRSERIEAWRRLPDAAGIRTLDAYGTSETTITSTVFDIPSDSGALEGSQVPVGRPVDGVRAHVVDRRLQPVPQGVAGELAIAGAGLARGYLGDPRATAERFVPDPYAPDGKGGARLYRTGDRARVLAGGDLLLLGRLDEQVKIRGFRVEPGEVEAVLGRLSGVREAVVVVGPADDEKSPLRAFVVVEADAPDATDPAALSKRLRERLPLHMLPRSVTPVAVLPRTATGKIDRRRLLAEAR